GRAAPRRRQPLAGRARERRPRARSAALRHPVVTRLGPLGRAGHEAEYERAERLELLVVATALIALLEHDTELPLGEDDVVVDVVDLPARDLLVSCEHL